MSQTVEVVIAGREYTLSTEQSDVYMQKLADYVSARILGFKRQNNASAVDAATMAAMAIADELLTLREKEKEKRKAKKKAKEAAVTEGGAAGEAAGE